MKVQKVLFLIKKYVYLLYAINNTSNIKVECCFTEKPFSVATIEGILNLINMNY